MSWVGNYSQGAALNCAENPVIFVCPDCKSALDEFRCPQCGSTFECPEGIPILLPHTDRFCQAASIIKAYDGIYTKYSEVWSNQGRTAKFIEYFVELLASVSTGKVLEIGCGEGFLLQAINASEKTAIDVSARALQRARARVRAEFGVALAERLPFKDGSFDMVVSVGVMEHFLDDKEAAREICRVLRPGGFCVTLIHVAMTFRQALALKISQYLFPHFRPLALARWFYGKATRTIVQPIQRRYTVSSAQECLQGSGLEVLRVISKRSNPSAPLAGSHVIIFISSKPLATPVP